VTENLKKCDGMKKCDRKCVTDTLTHKQPFTN
jgi:hypothetical protein